MHNKLFVATDSCEGTKGLRVKQQPDRQQQELYYHEHQLAVCIVLFHIYPPVCNKKAAVALYFGRICTRLGVVHSRIFRLHF